jgi:hypothetical protein
MLTFLLAVSLFDGSGEAIQGRVQIDGRWCDAESCNLETGRHTFGSAEHPFYWPGNGNAVRVLAATKPQQFGVGMSRSAQPRPEAPVLSLDVARLSIFAFDLQGELPASIRVARHADNDCRNPIERIDTVPLESYVAGVVHGEIGIFRAAGGGNGLQIERRDVDRRVLASFQTFAIAARTYVLWWYLRQGPDAEFHIHDGPCNQVYQDARDPVSEAAAESTSGMILVPPEQPNAIDKHEYASSCARHGTLPSYRNAHDVRRQDIVADSELERVCVGTWCGHDRYQMAHQDNPFLEPGNRCLVRGICQWGSLERSVRGDSFSTILQHYQPDLRVNQPAAELSLGSVQGNVMDRLGEPVAGARIVISRSDQEDTEFANSEGAYVFSQLDEGQVTLRVDAQGYQTQELEVRVVGGSITWQHFALFVVGHDVGGGADVGDGLLADGGQRPDAQQASDLPAWNPPSSCACNSIDFTGLLALVSLFYLARRRRRPGAYVMALHKESL